MFVWQLKCCSQSVLMIFMYFLAHSLSFSHFPLFENLGKKHDILVSLPMVRHNFGKIVMKLCFYKDVPQALH